MDSEGTEVFVESAAFRAAQGSSVCVRSDTRPGRPQFPFLLDEEGGGWIQTFQGSRGWPQAPLAWLPGAVFAHDLAHWIFPP